MKSIFKRVLVGVLVALILSFIRGNLFIGVSAKALYSHYSASQTYNFVSSSSTPYLSGGFIPISGSPFKNSGYGFINFTFSIISNIGARGQAIPYEVTADYNIQTACDISSTSFRGEQNFQTPYDNFGITTITAKCPVYITDDNYLRGFNVRLQHHDGNDLAQIRTSNIVTFYRFDDNVENALNNQTNNIINNQNQNSQHQIEAQKVCKTYDINNATINGYLDPNGNFVTPSSDKNVTSYINIDSATIKVLSIDTTYANPSACFYNSNKDLISCIRNNSMVANSELSIPSGASYVRFTINTDLKKPTFQICQNGNTAISNSQEEINNTLNNDNVSSNTGKGFFDDFQVNNHGGISGIVTAPLRLINSLSSSSCSSLSLPLPFVSQNATLPCMSGIYQQHFSSFLSIYRIITTGIIGYWVLIKLFGHIKGMQSPNDDRIEVFEL